mgnify:CR=1 FL=1
MKKESMTREEYTSYRLVIRNLCERNVWKNAKYIYLNASPETCFERIKKRNRDSEGGIPIEYIVSLDKLYSRVSAHTKKRVGEENVISIDETIGIDIITLSRNVYDICN